MTPNSSKIEVNSSPEFKETATNLSWLDLSLETAQLTELASREHQVIALSGELDLIEKYKYIRKIDKPGMQNESDFQLELFNDRGAIKARKRELADQVWGPIIRAFGGRNMYFVSQRYTRSRPEGHSWR
jgi:hypothetical protein